MNKKLSLIIKTLIVLMLVSSIGITTAEASLIIKDVTATTFITDDNRAVVRLTISATGYGVYRVYVDDELEWGSHNYSKEPTKDIYDLMRGSRLICVKDSNSESQKCVTVNVPDTRSLDTEAPIISNIKLDTPNPYINDYINITVTVTDNIHVRLVMADEGDLFRDCYSCDTWSGKILAVEGKHSITIVAYDEAYNVVIESIEYTATLPKPITSLLHITSLKLSSSVDVITAIVTTTGSGRLGIDLDTKALVFTKNVTNDGETKAEIKALLGEHTVCARDINNNKEIKCECVEIKPTSTPKPSSTSTTNLSLTLNTTQTKKNTSSSKNIDVYGRLNIDSDPGEADIFLNNVNYGTTPYSADIEIGSYTLKITKDGYKDFTKKVIVKESTSTDVTVTLVSINETTNTENNQSNQTTMFSGGNSKQSNGDSTTSLVNNMILLAAIVVIASTAIICVIVYSRKNTYINYTAPSSTTNEKSMIVLKRVDR